jgi:hypothetical protein
MQDIDPAPIRSPGVTFTKRIFSFTEVGLSMKPTEEQISQLPKLTKPSQFAKIEDPRPIVNKSLRSISSCKQLTRPSTGWDDFLRSNLHIGNTMHTSFTLSPTIKRKIEQTNERVDK